MGNIAVSFLTIKNHQADAIITGATGKSVQANVDLEQRTIDITTYLGGITTYLGNNTYETTCSPIANLITIDHENLISDEEKTKAINIVKSDPLSSMLFSENAEIKYVYRAQLQASCILTRDNGQTITTILNTSTIPAVVEVTSKNFVLTVVVDLNSEKVLALIPECVPSGSSITIPALTR